MSRARRLRRFAGAWRATPPAPAADVRVGAEELPAAVSARLADAVADTLDRTHAPGAQVVVRRGAATLWAADAGRAGGGDPVRPGDGFVIASTTKLVVATMLCALAERGELDLDAPVATWLPELPNAGRLTARLLLSQRSGLREYVRDEAIRRRFSLDARDHEWTRAEVLEAIVRLGAERDPDRRFAYRNSNYVVAAELAERAGGADIGTLLAELVARPLGLAGFSFEPAANGSRLTTPHAVVLGRAVDLLALTHGRIPTDALGPVWGDGGIVANAGDLARFVEALFGGAIVRPDTVADMVRSRSRAGRHAGYGLGVMRRRIGGVPVAGHDGMYFGWTASAGLDAATSTTVAVVANGAGAGVPAARIAAAVRGVLRDAGA